MPKRSYAERINSAKLMENGMKNNAKEAEVRGWNDEKTILLDKIRSRAEMLDAEQEKLKAELKMKTAELDAAMAELNDLMSEAKKVVKLGFEQKQWIEFGVTDKR